YDILGYPQRVPGVGYQGAVMKRLNYLRSDLEDQRLLIFVPDGNENEQLSQQTLSTVERQEHSTARLLQVFTCTCQTSSRIVKDTGLDNHVQRFNLLWVQDIGDFSQQARQRPLSVGDVVVGFVVVHHVFDIVVCVIMIVIVVMVMMMVVVVVLVMMVVLA